MTRLVPFKNHYDLVKKLQFGGGILLWISAVITISILLIDNVEQFKTYKIVLDILNPIITISSLLYFSIDVLQDFLFHQAEFNRKRDFIDNSFNSTLASSNSVGYFSNDTINPSILKLGVNCFENSFFTMNVTKKMLPSAIRNTALFWVSFLCLFFFTDQKTVATILQLALPFSVLIHLIKLLFLHYQVTQVFESFKTQMNSNPSNQQSANIIGNVIKYEKALSWAGILLDDKKFDKLNTVLPAEWDRIKQRYVQ
jgi:hypothetical protein